MIRFNDVEEFIAEVGKPFGPRDQIVRITTEQRRPAGLPIRHLYVRAAFIRGRGERGAPAEEIVELERFCGEVWGVPDDDKAIGTANDIATELRARLAAYDVRNGRFLVEDGKVK